MRPSQLWAAAAVAVSLGVSVAGCSGGSTAPTGGSQPTPTAARAGGASGGSPLAEAVAYSQCIRSHGVPDFPRPGADPQRRLRVQNQRN